MSWHDPVVVATAKLHQGDPEFHKGTAWLCGRGRALTAAHCVRTRESRTLDDRQITLKFPWGDLAASVCWYDFDLDVALLEISAEQVPAESKPLRLARLPQNFASAADDEGRGWSCYGFPRAQGSGLYLTGRITSPSGNLEGRRTLQLHCVQGGLRRLDGVSGAAVCHRGAAVGLIRHGILDQLVLHATPIDEVIEACADLRETISQVANASHPLHRFPKGPKPDSSRISNHLIVTFADLNPNVQAVRRRLHAAAQLRREADPGDPRATTLREIEIGAIGELGAIGYWTDAFDIACNHGPRMVAALILAQPDDLFDATAKGDRDQLLEYLATFNPDYNPPF